jgi:Coenzyme PQQ synthesis protein D (PqqD)
MESASSGAGAQAGDDLALNEERVMWREVDDEVIVLDKRTWTYMGINGSGAVLWREIAGGSTRPRLVARLLDAFGIDEERAGRDVDAFLELLRTHGLLAEASGA